MYKTLPVTSNCNTNRLSERAVFLRVDIAENTDYA